MRVLPIILSVLLFSSIQATTISTFKKKDPNISYSATVEENYVVVDVSITDPDVMRSMLGRGFAIYFDVKGKKKQNVSVTGPVLKRKGRQEGEARPDRSSLEASTEEEREIQLQPILADLPRNAIYTYYDSEESFNLDLNSLDIDLGYTVEKIEGKNVLSYQLKMPINKISTKEFDLNKLTIGIVSTQNEREEGNRGGLSIGGQGGGGRQGGGGPPGGGGGQGGSRGGQGGGDRPGQRPQMENVNVWFSMDQSE